MRRGNTSRVSYECVDLRLKTRISARDALGFLAQDRPRSIICPTRGPRSVAIWVGVNSKHSFPYLRYIRPVSQYCAFSLIILCPWWEYIYTEEQLIDKSADVHVVYVSKTQDLLNGPISDGCPFIQDQYGRVLYILHSPPGSEGFGVNQYSFRCTIAGFYIIGGYELAELHT